MNNLVLVASAGGGLRGWHVIVLLACLAIGLLPIIAAVVLTARAANRRSAQRAATAAASQAETAALRAEIADLKVQVNDKQQNG